MEETKTIQPEIDMTKVEKAGGYSRGCKEGAHEFSQVGTKLEIGSNGMTIMKMLCMICGQEVSVEAPLGINDLIVKHSGDVASNDPTVQGPMPQQQIQPQQIEPQPIMDMDDFWKKLKGGR